MNLVTFLDSEASGRDHLLLIGHPVGHSLSPLMHNTASAHYGLDVTYHAVDVLPDEFGRLAAHFNSNHFLGANVTIPYKKQLVSFLDEVDEDVQQAGAVNTIAKKQGRLVGYNTDIAGFLNPLQELDVNLDGTRSIVFGTGGAARAIVFALEKAGVEEIVIVSRDPGRVSGFENCGARLMVEGYGAWTAFAEEAALVVNATPLGMVPETGKSPVRDTETEFLREKVCYDIVYNPPETRFLKQASEAGCRECIGGLEMLIHQGSRSFLIWTGRPFPIEKVRGRIYEEIT